MSSEEETRVKKLVTVLATSTSITVARNEPVEDDENPRSNLAQVPCIHYSIKLETKSVLALLDSGSNINAIHPNFAKELGFLIRLTDVGAQKIDGTMLDTYEIVVAAFLVTDKANRIRLFEKTFLMANVSSKVVLGVSFLTLSDADIDFLVRELRWRTYATKKALSTNRRIKLVGKKVFATAVLDSEYEIYIVHVGSISSVALLSSFLLDADVHPFCRT